MSKEEMMIIIEDVGIGYEYSGIPGAKYTFTEANLIKLLDHVDKTASDYVLTEIERRLIDGQ